MAQATAARVPAPGDTAWSRRECHAACGPIQPARVASVPLCRAGTLGEVTTVRFLDLNTSQNLGQTTSQSLSAAGGLTMNTVPDPATPQPRLARGVPVELDELLADRDPLAAQIVRAGGLLKFGRSTFAALAPAPQPESPRPMTPFDKIDARHALASPTLPAPRAPRLRRLRQLRPRRLDRFSPGDRQRHQPQFPRPQRAWPGGLQRARRHSLGVCVGDATSSLLMTTGRRDSSTFDLLPSVNPMLCGSPFNPHSPQELYMTCNIGMRLLSAIAS